jgi:proline iminopeptidase
MPLTPIPLTWALTLAATLPLENSAHHPLPEARLSHDSVLPAREGYVQVAKDVRLFYRIYGTQGDTLVLVHGGPGGSMTGVGPDLLPLSERHVLLMYDQRGGGQSDLGADSTAITPATHVRDLEALRKYFRIDRMTLIGHSWGGILASLYAMEHRKQVSKLLLLSPMEPTRELFDARVKALATTDSSGEAELRALNAAPGSDPAATCRQQFAIVQRRYYRNHEAMARKRGDYCAVPTSAFRTGPIAQRRTLAALDQYDITEQLEDLTMPALVIEGADTPVPLEGCRTWAASLGAGSLWLIKGAGHGYPFVEVPEIFFPGVEQFLAGQLPPGAVLIVRARADVGS